MSWQATQIIKLNRVEISAEPWRLGIRHSATITIINKWLIFDEVATSRKWVRVVAKC